MIMTTVIMTESDAQRVGVLEQMCDQLNEKELPVFDSYFNKDRKQIGSTVVGSAKIDGNSLVCDVEISDDVNEVTTVWRQDDGWLISLESSRF
jgi:hypothetical protein